MNKTFNRIIVKFITRKVSFFESSKGFFSINFPDGWRVANFSSKEYLFFQDTTNRAITIKPIIVREKSVEEYLNNYRLVFLKEEIIPVEYEVNGLKIIRWQYDFISSKTIEIKRLVYNNSIILEISSFVESNLDDKELHFFKESTENIFSTIKIK